MPWDHLHRGKPSCAVSGVENHISSPPKDKDEQLLQSYQRQGLNKVRGEKSQDKDPLTFQGTEIYLPIYRVSKTCVILVLI